MLNHEGIDIPDVHEPLLQECLTFLDGQPMRDFHCVAFLFKVFFEATRLFNSRHDWLSMRSWCAAVHV